LKKFISLITVALFVLGMVSFAFAVDVEFGGDARVRGVNKYNYDADKSADDDNAYYDQRYRLKITAKADNGVEARARIRISDATWDNSSTVGDTGGNVTADYAYLHVPIGNVTIDVGRQIASWGNKFMVWNAETNRLKVYTKVSGMTVGVFTDKKVETNDDFNSQDFNDYAAFLITKAGGLKVGILGVYYKDDTTPDNDGQLINVFTNGKIGNLGVAAEIAYKGGDLFETTASDGADLGAFALVTAGLGKATVGGAVAYAKDGYTTDNDFTPTYFFGTSQIMAITNFGAQADDKAYAALAFANFKATSDLSVLGRAAYANLGENAAGDDMTIIEIDAGLTYKLGKNTAYSLAVAYGMPSDWNTEDDNILGMSHKIEVKF